MGSVDKAAIVWTIAIVLIGASVAIVGSNFDQADSKQDMKMTGSMNDDMMMQDGKMTDMEKMMDYDRDSSGDKTTEKMMDEKMMDEKMTMKETGPVTKSVSIPSGTSVPGCEDADKCFIPSKVSINAGDRCRLLFHGLMMIQQYILQLVVAFLLVQLAPLIAV